MHTQTNKRKKKFKEDLFDDLNSSPKQEEHLSRKTSRPKKRPKKVYKESIIINISDFTKKWNNLYN